MITLHKWYLHNETVWLIELEEEIEDAFNKLILNKIDNEKQFFIYKKEYVN